MVKRSPVVDRLQAVMNVLNNFVQTHGDTSFANFSLIMEAVTEEVIEELEDRDDEALASYMEMMGSVIAWIGHGNTDLLPEQLRVFAEELHPTLAEVS